MVYDRERERRNDDVVAAHKEALARGEKRVLRVTTTGELHSYADDEIGFSPGRGQAQVSTWWGMGIVTAVIGLLFLASWVLLFLPLAKGEQPFSGRSGPHRAVWTWSLVHLWARQGRVPGHQAPQRARRPEAR